ncbi:MAG: tetraacyldisaccharide 4'-kinase [Cytophagaceae bacterium]|nr:tetraacyldisaccharide 4'-kinase [Cytophagaceae bacterium]
MRILFSRLIVISLYPLSILYGCVMVLRNILYDTGFFKKQFAPIFSIGIGNITVGGTGKTPHVEYLIKHFFNKKIAILSRGYGRKTKGFLAVDSTMGASQVGDEPWQFFLKYGKYIHVNVGEKRVLAAQKIHELYPEVDTLIMDDVFQHRAIQADYSILLCDYNFPFYKDYTFPAGRLREFRCGAKRADIIVVSKCPASISLEEKNTFRKKINSYAPGIPIAFSSLSYMEVRPLGNSDNIPQKWLLVTGIANPKPLVSYLKSQNSLLKHIAYSDHHDFSYSESLDVINAYYSLNERNAGILITEKDSARLNKETIKLWKDLPLFFIPVEVELLEGEELLLQNIAQAMNRRAGFPIN